MFEAPVKGVVDALALLPDALRPGVFLALVVLIVWAVFLRRGIANAWHAACRGMAVLVYFGLGLVLLPEYAATRARRRRGEKPWPVAVTAGDVTERVSASAAAVYERHESQGTVSRRLPRRFVVVLVAGCALPWVVMDRLPVTDEAKYQLASVFQHWRDVEAWADVNPSRRAASGAPRQPLPRIAGARRRGERVRVRLRCARSEPCIGKLVVTTASGQEVYSSFVAVKAQRSKALRFTLPSEHRSRLKADVKRP